MLSITYLRLCFFVVKEIKSHIWFFSFQHNSSYIQSGLVVLLVDFLSSEHAQNPAHSRLYRITKQQLQSSRLQQCRAFIGLSNRWKKADSAANLFFVTLGNGNPKNSKLKILVKAAQCKIWQILTPDFLQEMSCRILVLNLLKPKKLVKSHAPCLRGLLNVLAFAQLLSDLNCQEPRVGGGRAGPTQHGA